MTKTMPIRIDAELHSVLKDAADAADVSISDIIAKSLNGMKPYREYKLKFSISFADRLDIQCLSSGLKPEEYIESNLKFTDHPPGESDSFELPDFL